MFLPFNKNVTYLYIVKHSTAIQANAETKKKCSIAAIPTQSSKSRGFWTTIKKTKLLMSRQRHKLMWICDIMFWRRFLRINNVIMLLKKGWILLQRKGNKTRKCDLYPGTEFQGIGLDVPPKLWMRGHTMSFFSYILL